MASRVARSWIGCLLAGVVVASCSQDGGEADVPALNFRAMFSEVPEQAPPVAVQQQVSMGSSWVEPDGRITRIPLDPDAVRLVAEPLPGVQTFAVRYGDGSGICLIDTEAGEGGAAMACVDADGFNERGLTFAAENSRGSYTVILLPDGTEIVDLGAGVVQPSGSAVVLPGLALDAQVRNGQLDL